MKYQKSLKKDIKSQASYTQLAMRNIRNQKNKTLSHFLITMLFLSTFFIGISYLSK